MASPAVMGMFPLHHPLPRDPHPAAGAGSGCRARRPWQSLAAELRGLRAQADEAAAAHEREAKILRDQATAAAKQRDGALREVNPPPPPPPQIPSHPSNIPP